MKKIGSVFADYGLMVAAAALAFILADGISYLPNVGYRVNEFTNSTEVNRN
jgi:hypothetical protein